MAVLHQTRNAQGMLAGDNLLSGTVGDSGKIHA